MAEIMGKKWKKMGLFGMNGVSVHLCVCMGTCSLTNSNNALVWAVWV